MGFFDRLKSAISRTTSALTQEVKRIITSSPKLTAASMEELEAALLGADLGLPMTHQILAAAKVAFETQGKGGLDFIDIAAAEVEKSLRSSAGTHSLGKCATGVTVVSVVGVNGTGKTTTSAKLAYRVKQGGHLPLLAACDTFRAAAIQLQQHIRQ